MAGMTLTEKVLAKASGKDRVQPGELVWANVYSIMTMDYIGKSTFNLSRLYRVPDVFDKNRVDSVSLITSSPDPAFAAVNEMRKAVKATQYYVFL
jgi:3-isopropylmalate/(R)-2-methylmalate dehydratase large subunit